MNRYQMLQRTNYPDTNFAGIIILICLIVIIVLIIILYKVLKKRFNLNLSKEDISKKYSFYSLAKSVELESDEIKTLFSLVNKYNIKYPMTCFTNAKILDELIKKALTDIEKDNKLTPEEKTVKSSNLLEIKVKIEKNSRKNTGIRSTHLISERQKIVIFIRNIGYFYSIVRKTSPDYIAIELLSDKINKRILSAGDFLKAYFWREEDAGYIFETNIIKTDEHNVKIYYIKHSDNLVRTQKRKYRRIPVNLLGEVQQAEMKISNKKRKFTVNDLTTSKCIIKNLSAGGLLMLVERTNFTTEILKILFDVNNIKVSVFGKIIRSHTTFGGKEVTIQFVGILLKDKNIINRYVYNYMPGL